jgi:hypothetical protein
MYPSSSSSTTTTRTATLWHCNSIQWFFWCSFQLVVGYMYYDVLWEWM